MAQAISMIVCLILGCVCTLLGFKKGFDCALDVILLLVGDDNEQ